MFPRTLFLLRAIGMSNYYAVAKGREPGIYRNWDECKEQVQKFSGAIYKKFSSYDEAEDFLREKTTSKTVPRTASVKRPADSALASSSNKIMKMMKLTPVDSQEGHSKVTIGDGKYSFDRDEEGYVIVYTDGACTSNGVVGAKAGIGVYFAENHPLNVSEPLKGRATNNHSEIQAVIQACEQAKRAGVDKLRIHTDSQFVINCVTKWMRTWKANGWKTAKKEDVINRVELEKLEKSMEGLVVVWTHVRGHVGILGNERADKLAREGAKRYSASN